MSRVLEKEQSTHGYVENQMALPQAIRQQRQNEGMSGKPLWQIRLEAEKRAEAEQAANPIGQLDLPCQLPQDPSCRAAEGSSKSGVQVI